MMKQRALMLCCQTFLVKQCQIHWGNYTHYYQFGYHLLAFCVYMYQKHCISHICQLGLYVLCIFFLPLLWSQSNHPSVSVVILVSVSKYTGKVELSGIFVSFNLCGWLIVRFCKYQCSMNIALISHISCYTTISHHLSMLNSSSVMLKKVQCLFIISIIHVWRQCYNVTFLKYSTILSSCSWYQKRQWRSTKLWNVALYQEWPLIWKTWECCGIWQLSWKKPHQDNWLTV